LFAATSGPRRRWSGMTIATFFPVGVLCSTWRRRASVTNGCKSWRGATAFRHDAAALRFAHLIARQKVFASSRNKVYTECGIWQMRDPCGARRPCRRWMVSRDGAVSSTEDR
jgi:hypothetical protein